VLADFRSYVEAQERATLLYQDQRAWSAAAIHNIAGMGYFSSDRAIQEYASQIWGIEPVKVNMNG
jgi:starch phosphorylase